MCVGGRGGGDGIHFFNDNEKRKGIHVIKRKSLGLLALQKELLRNPSIFYPILIFKECILRFVSIPTY